MAPWCSILAALTAELALFRDVAFGEAWRPVEDESYQEEPEAVCMEASLEEKEAARKMR